MKKVATIVPAAGLGKRFGQGGNKPFQVLGNKPLVVWVFEVLESINEIAEIIPVFKKDDMALGCDLLEKFKFSKVKRIAPGGKERQDSVYGALALIDKETDVVLIHDGVRPLVDRDLIERAIRELLIPPHPPLLKGGIKALHSQEQPEHDYSKGQTFMSPPAKPVYLKELLTIGLSHFPAAGTANSPK